jgi:acetolactate synthase-1/3 small subunit
MKAETMEQPASAYFMEERHDPNETHTLSVLVQNEPGVLARVIGLFSGRGYNIDSLTVSETEHAKHMSLITIVTTGTPMVIQQIKHQLDRMIPVYRVVDMTLTGRAIERELAMVKVKGTGDLRMEALRLSEAFRARVIDATTESFVFEITGGTAKIDQFVNLMVRSVWLKCRAPASPPSRADRRRCNCTPASHETDRYRAGGGRRRHLGRWLCSDPVCR